MDQVGHNGSSSALDLGLPPTPTRESSSPSPSSCHPSRGPGQASLRSVNKLGRDGGAVPGLVRGLQGSLSGGSKGPGGSLVFAVFLEHRCGWGLRTQGVGTALLMLGVDLASF